MNIDQSETPKHLKRKPSSKSLSKNRSDHKHEYEKVLIKTLCDIHWSTRCKLCGRFGGGGAVRFFDPDLYTECTPVDDRLCASRLLIPSKRPLHISEIREKYPDVKIYETGLKQDENGKILHELTYTLLEE